MATLKELIAQKEVLDHKIDEAKAHNRTEGLTKVKELMAEYGLTATDFGGRGTATLLQVITGAAAGCSRVG